LTRLYLVSCAQTTSDKEGVFQGSSNHRLSREGIKHTKLLGRYLQAERIDSFYSSPWEGAFNTASILAGRHRRGVVRMGDLQDMDYGKWIGKTMEGLQATDPEMFITWQFEPHKHRMPGGETLGEVQERIVQALERILSVEKASGVCVVTHTIPAKTAMCHFINDDLSIIWLTPRQESTTLNIIDFEDDEARVIEVGSSKHLSEEVAT
jgi:alpha-ribazole phosphatase